MIIRFKSLIISAVLYLFLLSPSISSSLLIDVDAVETADQADSFEPKRLKYNLCNIDQKYHLQSNILQYKYYEFINLFINLFVIDKKFWLDIITTLSPSIYKKCSDENLLTDLKVKLLELITLENFHIYIDQFQNRKASYCDISEQHLEDPNFFYKDFIEVKVFNEDYFESLNQIQSAVSQNNLSLDLKFSGQSCLNPDIFKIIQLRQLDLSSSMICFISEQIYNLENLEVLNIIDCDELMVLPADLWKLSRLKTLYIDDRFETNPHLRRLLKLTSNNLIVYLHCD